MTDVKDKECQHCWHGTGQMLTSYPPQIPEVCCHCGEHRTKMEQVPFTATGHGKFAPHTYFSIPKYGITECK